MRLFFVAICSLFFTCIVGQKVVESNAKPPLRISDLGKWPYVENAKISNDGKYVIYTSIEGQSRSLVIKAVDGTYEKWISGSNTNDGVITENSQFVVAKTKDSLFILKLSENRMESIASAKSYKTPDEGSGEWLAYQLGDERKILVLRNLVTGEESRHVSVNEYQFSKDGSALLLKRDISNHYYVIELLYPATGKLNAIWEGKNASNFCFDMTGKKIAFIGRDDQEKSLNSLWYYHFGMDRAVRLADKKSKGVDSSLFIGAHQVRFNKNGNKIFFYLEPLPSTKANPMHTSVDVWHWQDSKLQSKQLAEVGRIVKFLSVVNLQHDTSPGSRLAEVLQLEREGEQVMSKPQEYKSDYVVVTNDNHDYNEYYWNSASAPSFFLINTSSGSRRLLTQSIVTRFWISPDEQYIITYDVDKKNYLSHNVTTGRPRNITQYVTSALNNHSADRVSDITIPYGFGGWLKSGKALFVYDEYDIWKVDPSSENKPICITNGYGRRNKIILRLLDNNLQQEGKEALKYYIIGLNTLTKGSSIYHMASEMIEMDPILLFSGDCFLYDYSGKTDGEYFEPRKSKFSDKYLISMQTGTEPSNYYVTSDFKSFSKITYASSPNKAFNWHKRQLVTWNTFDGLQSQGILYKPDNFDSSRKYPVIIYFYEKLSQNLNAYLKPDFSKGPLNIPYFVSNGYLVFTPDIKYTIGKPGNSAYKSVISAVKHLVKMPWVDASRIGIQGHSFGGYEVNYLVSHTDMFAAAVSAAGLSNLISQYGSLFDGQSSQFQLEVGQLRIGATLWEKPNLYISNSPIFNADKVTTPLLLMNNKRDQAVPFSQGVEMFTALRRLGKKGWMLQYDNGYHSVGGEDFTIRMKQFFDHYLKDSACPRWMLYGIPAKDKGIDNGYELVKEKDPKTGKWLSPKEGGLLTDEEKKKVEALKRRKPITVTIE